MCFKRNWLWLLIGYCNTHGILPRTKCSFNSAISAIRAYHYSQQVQTNFQNLCRGLWLDFEKRPNNATGASAAEWFVSVDISLASSRGSIEMRLAVTEWLGSRGFPLCHVMLLCCRDGAEISRRSTIIKYISMLKQQLCVYAALCIIRSHFARFKRVPLWKPIFAPLCWHYFWRGGL